MPRTKRAASTSGNHAAGCLLTIQNLYPQMTAKEKLIADYVLGHRDVVYHSITEFVASSRAGYGSVIRFCKRLGYNGFQDFKIGLAEDLAVQKAAGSPAARGSFDAQAEEACQNIRRTAELVSRTDFEAAAKALASARSVLAVGSGVCASTAKEIEHGLTRLGILAVSAQDQQVQQIRAAALSGEDVIVLVSFSGRDVEIRTAGEIARGAGALVVCLTNSPVSPVCSIAQHKLVTGVRVDPGRDEIPSKVATHFVIDALLRQVATIIAETPHLRAKRQFAVTG